MIHTFIKSFFVRLNYTFHLFTWKERLLMIALNVALRLRYCICFKIMTNLIFLISWLIVKWYQSLLNFKLILLLNVIPNIFDRYESFRFLELQLIWFILDLTLWILLVEIILFATIFIVFWWLVLIKLNLWFWFIN